MINRILAFTAALCILLEAGIAGAQEPIVKERATGSPFAQGKYVPDISFIVDFSTVARTMSDERYASLEIPGFTHVVPGEGLSHEAMNATNGFNLNYGELTLASAVDPYFDLFAAFHLTEESFEMEEVYFTTRALPFGFSFRGGKFRSGFGRLNEQHPHVWDFADAPLVTRAFFGDEGLVEVGARLSWIAPLPFYVSLNAEILRGANEASFGTEGFRDFPGTHAIGDSPPPNLKVGYARSSFDIGALSVLYGVSYAMGESRINAGVDADPAENPDGYALRADTGILGADITLKFLINSYRFLSLQAEYLNRTMKGDRFDNAGGRERIEKKQSGMYAQSVFRFAQRWRTGYRFDLLDTNKEKIGGVSSKLPENLMRHTAMIEFVPTEFSRIRLQGSHDRSGYLDGAAKRTTNDEVFLAFTMAIGAHGAHSY
ncbi:MAG: hypothetical protein EPN93_06405 [Spirochaetes bacterium]|nr:MAG: hypothetical protein EPN93_06405 [Spirochaetota bacterium]